MNLEKVIFAFFVVLALTLNFGFFFGDIDNQDHHPVVVGRARNQSFVPASHRVYACWKHLLHKQSGANWRKSARLYFLQTNAGLIALVFPY